MPAPMVAPETSMAASARGRGNGRPRPAAPQATTATIAPDIQAAGMPRRWNARPPAAATRICAAWERTAAATSEHGGQPPHRLLEVLVVAGEAQAQIALAARPEGGAGGEPDARLVDETERERAGVGHALDLEEGGDGAGR